MKVCSEAYVAGVDERKWDEQRTVVACCDETVAFQSFMWPILINSLWYWHSQWGEGDYDDDVAEILYI